METKEKWIATYISYTYVYLLSLWGW